MKEIPMLVSFSCRTFVSFLSQTLSVSPLPISRFRCLFLRCFCCSHNARRVLDCVVPNDLCFRILFSSHFSLLFSPNCLSAFIFFVHTASSFLPLHLLPLSPFVVLATALQLKPLPSCTHTTQYQSLTNSHPIHTHIHSSRFTVHRYM